MSFKDKFSGKQEIILKYAPSMCVIFALCFFLAPSSKALNNSYYILVLAPTVLIVNKIGFKDLWKSFHFKVFTVFCIWMALSILWSEPQKAKEVKYVAYVYFYILAITWAFKNRAHISNKFIYPFVVIASIASLIMFVVSKYVRNEPRLKLIDSHGMFETALTGGNTLCFFMITAVALLFYFKEKLIRLLIALSIITMLILLLHTGSRSSLLALLVGLSAFFIIKYASKKVIIVGIVSASVLLLGIFIFLHSNNWFRFPGSNQGNLHYNLSVQDAENIKISKKMIENKKWEGAFQEILINGRNVDFKDSDEIILPVETDNLILNLISSETGMQPFRCFGITAVKKDGTEIEMPIQPPRLLDIDLTFNIRTTTWSLFIKEIKKSPIMGHGLSQRTKVYVAERDIWYKDTHNMMVGTTMRGGLVALLLWIVFIIYAFIVLFKNRNALLFGLLTAGFVFTLFDDDNFFKAPLPYWLCMLVPLACSFVIDSQRGNIDEEPVTASDDFEEEYKLKDTICV